MSVFVVLSVGEMITRKREGQGGFMQDGQVAGGSSLMIGARGHDRHRRIYMMWRSCRQTNE